VLKRLQLINLAISKDGNSWNRINIWLIIFDILVLLFIIDFYIRRLFINIFCF